MAAGKYNFTIEQGATFRKQITWRDVANNPVNLTGYAARCKIKDRIGGDTALSLNTSSGGIEITPLLGLIELYAGPTITAALTIKKGVYDLELIAPSGDVTRLLSGKVSISPEVTT